MENKLPDLDELIILVFSKMSTIQLIFLCLFAVTWLGGANILIHFHRKRIGEDLFSESHPFKYFNAKEWLILVLLLFTSLTFGVMAGMYGQETSPLSCSKV